ncbi:farnesyl diphosphate synthase [Lactarius akahatsu]|uniref:(2E,6E)-farnesyl diphosphate synthase n=1 Tax=Lactarius akahatsu TaxID=416441 RepID=A0AAD4L686_9AGAM|nr:farnesyl diphosphate synthase [Lactarius akahatsu]
MAPIATSPTPTPTPLPPTAVKDKKAAARKRFEAVYAVVRDDLLDDFRKHNMPEEAIEYYRRSMDYNVPGGKLNRGLSVVDTVAILKGRELTETEYFKAAVLGWSVEWMQAYFLVSDDIMDSSITRRGQPCWYRMEGVGFMAVNDALILEGAIFQMIRKHFRKESYYVDIIDLLHEVSYQTEMGQLVDLITAPEDSVDLSKFSLARHSTIVIYKTALYSFYLPVALALLLCGFPVEKRNESDPDYYKIALDILVPLGEYFQIQDDYLDYSGTPEQIGKIGTDIVDNKCSWCINTALAHANPEQRAILDASYGRKDPAAEERVKEIFRQVGVDNEYAEYEAQSYARINTLIAAVPEVRSPNGDAVLRRAVFSTFLEKIYKRTK